MSHCSKVIKPGGVGEGEGGMSLKLLIYSWLVRSAGDNLVLQLALEAGRVQSYRTEPVGSDTLSR